MINHDEEGTDFEVAMREQLAQPVMKHAKERLQAERKAGRTPKQRAKRAKKTRALNFRTGDETFGLVVALMAKLGTDKTSVLERAVACLAKKEGVKAGD